MVCPNGNCSNGYGITSGVVLDSAGDVFGGTSYAGGFYDLGTLFEIKAGTRKAIDIHDLDGTHGAYAGGDQFGTSLLEQDGSFIGTTPHGGKNVQSCSYGGGGCGVVYEMTP